ncbi:MAG: hypothetical protein H6727_05910 [Myxococcales bacterium]|nr:hypothetical protein [Myxococcales bacterium]
MSAGPLQMVDLGIKKVDVAYLTAFVSSLALGIVTKMDGALKIVVQFVIAIAKGRGVFLPSQFMMLASTVVVGMLIEAGIRHTSDVISSKNFGSKLKKQAVADVPIRTTEENLHFFHKVQGHAGADHTKIIFFLSKIFLHDASYRNLNAPVKNSQGVTIVISPSSNFSTKCPHIKPEVKARPSQLPQLSSYDGNANEPFSPLLYQSFGPSLQLQWTQLQGAGHSIRVSRNGFLLTTGTTEAGGGHELYRSTKKLTGDWTRDGSGAAQSIDILNGRHAVAVSKSKDLYVGELGYETSAKRSWVRHWRDATSYFGNSIRAVDVGAHFHPAELDRVIPWVISAYASGGSGNKIFKWNLKKKIR